MTFQCSRISVLGNSLTTSWWALWIEPRNFYRRQRSELTEVERQESEDLMKKPVGEMNTIDWDCYQRRCVVEAAISALLYCELAFIQTVRAGLRDRAV